MIIPKLKISMYIFNLRIIIYNTMFVISRVSPSLQRTLIDIFIWNVLNVPGVRIGEGKRGAHRLTQLYFAKNS